MTERLIAKLEALPMIRAGKSRDFGRGYSMAIKDAVAILRAHVCKCDT